MKWNVAGLLSGLLVVMMLALAGCGGGSDSSVAPTPPAISALQYTPASLSQNTVTSVDWHFDFADAGGDVTTGTYIVYDPSGVQVFAKTINLTIPAGITNGTQFGTTSPVTFLNTGTYTVKMFVTDRAGVSSNTLTATFTIVP